MVTMATKSAVSLEDYLHTSYPTPDPEYRDGEIVERGVPDYQHGRTQLKLGSFFEACREQHQLFAAVETRVRVGPARRALDAHGDGAPGVEPRLRRPHLARHQPRRGCFRATPVPARHSEARRAKLLFGGSLEPSLRAQRLP